MKTGKIILVTGIAGVIGVFGYLYLKNKKKTPVTTGNGISDLINSVLPSTDSSSESTTPLIGTSNVVNDPLLTESQNQIATAVVTKINENANTITAEQQKEADDYLLKLAQQKKTEEEARVLSARYYETKKKYESELNSSKKSLLFIDLNRTKNQLKAMGYVSTGNGTIQAI